MKVPTPARLALAGAAVVAAGAFIGSASALLHIGTTAQMTVPAALPLSLDAIALVAAVVIRARRHDWLAWLALLTTVSVSTTLQIAAAPADLMARTAHAVPAIAAVVAFELALRLAGPVRELSPMGDKPRSASAKPAKRATKRPAKKATAPTPALVELVPAARAVADELVINGDRVSRRNLQAGLEAAGTPVRNSGRAGELLRLVNEPVR
jgi:hypothetical protein